MSNIRDAARRLVTRLDLYRATSLGEPIDHLMDWPEWRELREAAEAKPEPLVQIGEVQLNSGQWLDWKLIADDFIRENLEGLVHLIRSKAGPFSHVYGIPRGGSLLEEALFPHASRSLQSTCLVVDDVLTTGGSFKRAKEKLSGTYSHFIGWTVFSRGPCPGWVTSVFQMPEPFWPRNGVA